MFLHCIINLKRKRAIFRCVGISPERRPPFLLPQRPLKFPTRDSRKVTKNWPEGAEEEGGQKDSEYQENTSVVTRSECTVTRSAFKLCLFSLQRSLLHLSTSISHRRTRMGKRNKNNNYHQLQAKQYLQTVITAVGSCQYPRLVYY